MPLYCLAALLLLGACPGRSTPPDAGSRASKPDSFALVAVKAGVGLMFTFFDSRAQMRTVGELSQVEATARAEVMVTNPKTRLPGDLIYVTDLRKKRKDNTFRVWVEQKSSWLDRVMPKKSVLEQPVAVARAKPAKRKRKRRPRRVRKPRRVATAPAQGPTPRAQAKQAAPQVILFSTAWCPACKKARQYFQARRIPFRELDVQKDPKAAQLYVAVQKRYGLKPGLVPVIVVNGRVFGGFSPQHIEAALKAGPPKG